jgi:hypothetical protein
MLAATLSLQGVFLWLMVLLMIANGLLQDTGAG